MKKLRPFGIVFLVIQCVLFLALMVLPGYFASLLSRDLDGLFWLFLFLLAALAVLLVDAIWVAVVLRRYHARHREVAPVRALTAWGIYLAAAVVAGPYMNLLVLAGEVPPLSLQQWGILLLLYVLPALIPAVVLWLPAFLLSFLDSHYRYTSKKAETTESPS